MAKHKPMCWVVSILMIVGGLNWGLYGLGMLIGMNLNIVNLLLGGVSSSLEAIVYLLVGASAVMTLIFMCSCKECACTKSDKKM